MITSSFKLQVCNMCLEKTARGIDRLIRINIYQMQYGWFGVADDSIFCLGLYDDWDVYFVKRCLWH